MVHIKKNMLDRGGPVSNIQFKQLSHCRNVSLEIIKDSRYTKYKGSFAVEIISKSFPILIVLSTLALLYNIYI